MLKFLTESGSLYEVDVLLKRVRRLEGEGDPTPRMGIDGVWRTYEDIDMQVGKGALIVWTDEVPPIIPGWITLAKCTSTSKIVRFINEDADNVDRSVDNESDG